MSTKLAWDIFRWALIVVGGALFAYGFGFGRWDAAVMGLLLMQFAMAISLKLKILGLKSPGAAKSEARKRK